MCVPVQPIEMMPNAFGRPRYFSGTFAPSFVTGMRSFVPMTFAWSVVCTGSSFVASAEQPTAPTRAKRETEARAKSDVVCIVVQDLTVVDLLFPHHGPVSRWCVVRLVGDVRRSAYVSGKNIAT